MNKPDLLSVTIWLENYLERATEEAIVLVSVCLGMTGLSVRKIEAVNRNGAKIKAKLCFLYLEEKIYHKNNLIIIQAMFL